MPTFIETCAGAGGLSLGLQKAGWEPLMLNDNNKDCCATLKKNHPNVDIRCCDMQDIDMTPFVDKVDLLAYGAPCQSWSHAGQRQGFEDERGNLFLLLIKLIKQVRPKIFLIENVKGLLSHNNGESFKYILHKLEKIGLYKIQYKVLNAVNYKTPQKRERVFIVGVSDGLDSFKFPEPVTDEKTMILKDFLKDVPESPCAKYSKAKERLFKMIPQGGCWVDLPEDLQREYLGKSYDTGGGKRGILRRLSMNEPCLTLLCSPTQKQTERCHPIETRPLSVREYARIQTFPDSYEFVGSMASQYKQIGNAVSVQVAKSMGKALLKCFD
jgi:DNA (cytosine-5)-methyltransferase 1